MNSYAYVYLNYLCVCVCSLTKRHLVRQNRAQPILHTVAAPKTLYLQIDSFYIFPFFVSFLVCHFSKQLPVYVLSPFTMPFSYIFFFFRLWRRRGNYLRPVFVLCTRLCDKFDLTARYECFPFRVFSLYFGVVVLINKSVRSCVWQLYCFHSHAHTTIDQFVGEIYSLRQLKLVTTAYFMSQWLSSALRWQIVTFKIQRQQDNLINYTTLRRTFTANETQKKTK